MLSCRQAPAPHIPEHRSPMWDAFERSLLACGNRQRWQPCDGFARQRKVQNKNRHKNIGNDYPEAGVPCHKPLEFAPCACCTLFPSSTSQSPRSAGHLKPVAEQSNQISLCLCGMTLAQSVTERSWFLTNRSLSKISVDFLPDVKLQTSARSPHPGAQKPNLGCLRKVSFGLRQ